MSAAATTEAGTATADPDLAAVLDGWRTAGRDLVASHWDEFNRLVDPIEPLVAAGRFAEAVAAAQVAANYAVFWHPGVFASQRLERAIAAIGAAALPFPVSAPAPAPASDRPAGDAPLRVLHVATQVGEIGGHVRMMWRWISHDRANRHSVALTRQTDRVPALLAAAVAASGGAIDCANGRIGGPLGWARALQRRLAEADLVVLHVHNQDVLPFLALAGMARRPKVVLLNHADHVFWLGAEFADLVVSTRLSGDALARDRRGIAAERSVTLPLCLQPVARASTRAEARRALGLPDDALVLLTIARAVKFRRLGQADFPDALAPLLEADPRLHLVVVGPGGAVDWSRAEARAPGRIHAFPETPETATFYEAADIYLDSFPFPSNTSLLEAGLRGVPLVTRNPFGPGCEIMGADSIGLDEVMIRTADAAALRAAIAALVADPARRAAIGARTQANIEAANSGAAWSAALAEVHARALALPARTMAPADIEAPSFAELDLLLPFVFGTVLERPSPRVRLANAREIALKTLPPLQRLRTWAGMAWRDEFRFRSTGSSWRYLLPEWSTVLTRRVMRARIGDA